MPRKKQVVQRQRRQKAYNPAAFSGEATHLKRRGAFRLFSNYKLFVVIGAIALGGGVLASSLFATSDSGRTGETSVRGEGVIKQTPDPDSSTATTDGGTTVKRYTAPPALTIDANKTYTATIKTSKGDIKVELLPQQAPETVNNFVFLARDGFYNGVTFFRVEPDFVAQAGDPTGTGIDGPGYDLPVEQTEVDFTAGILAMAKPQQAGSPNNGSQFFITLTDAPSLEGKFTAFGRVVEGMDVLRQLTAHQAGDSEPGERIETIEITET